jgi:CRISPR-associated protein Csm2
MPNYPQQHPQGRTVSGAPQTRGSLQAIKSAIGNQHMANFGPEKFAERDGLAEQFIEAIQGDRKAKGLNSTQLRKIFHQVKRLEQQFRPLKPADPIPRAEIALLSAQLAYASGRDLIPDDFFELTTYCLNSDRCSTKADFDNVAKFLEALMAYHKYHSS